MNGRVVSEILSTIPVNNDSIDTGKLHKEDLAFQ